MSVKPDVKTTRLRNTKSGAIVSVAPDKADRMGTEWEPVVETPRKASTTKKSATSDPK